MLQEIDSLISRDFDEIHQNVKDIVRNSTNTDQAVQDIVNYVSGKLTASCKGYAALLYSVKSKATLQEKIFESDENANRFYDLNLRQKLADAYQFNVSDLSSCKDRRDCKEVKERFGPTAVKAAAVSGALAAAMLGMLAIPTHIPLVVVMQDSEAVIMPIKFLSRSRIRASLKRQCRKLSISRNPRSGAGQMDLSAITMIRWAS